MSLEQQDGEPSLDELAELRRAVRERTDASNAALQLAVKALQTVGRPDSSPVGLRKRKERRRSSEALLEALDGLRHLRAEPELEVAQLLRGIGTTVGAEDGGDELAQP